MHLPWLELAILIPFVGGLYVSRIREPQRAQRDSVIIKSLVLLCAVGAWQDFNTLHAYEAHDRWDLFADVLGNDVLVIDELSAPLLPLAALIYLATAVATLRTKVKRYSFAGSLLAEAILLATLSCRQPWFLIGLLAAGTLMPWAELRSRGKPTRVYALHIGLYVLLLAAGQALLAVAPAGSALSTLAIILLTAGVLIRSGVFPLHVWMTDLFEHATFGTALLFATPMVGAYAAVRLVLPVAPDWILRSVGLLSLFTAMYAAGMALVQREARRFFCYLFLSHASLVLVGLEVATAVGITGALSVWLSIGLALSGFGLTLRSMEARAGRLSLSEYHGLAEHTPMLAAFFLLTGLASVGFPGTFGFIGTELLIEGVVGTYPYVGPAVVLVAALNGIAVVQAYFRVFAGTSRSASISLRCRPPERLAVLALTALILGGGLFPQPGITSRYHPATVLVEARRGLSASAPAENAHASTPASSTFPWAVHKAGPQLPRPAQPSAISTVTSIHE